MNAPNEEAVIREYRPGDLDAICAIADAAWQPIYDMYHEAYGDELFRIKVPDRSTSKGLQVRSHAERHPDQIVVCELGGRLAGFATYGFLNEGRTGVIRNNAVSPECAGRGIGPRMYARVIEIFRERGCLYAEVGTGLDDAHAPARRAYEKAGFDMEVRSVTYYMKLQARRSEGSGHD